MHSNRYSRRMFLQRAAVVGGVVVAGSACGGGQSSTKTAVFADYGGTVREARVKAFLEPFEKESGIKVRTADADPAKFVAMAERKRSQWDLVDADGFSVIEWNDRGILEELPESVTRCDMVPKKYQSLATGGYTQAFNIVYRKDAFPKGGPESWADFWNVKKYPGKRGFQGSYLAAVEAALLADGVAKDELYPLDFDRGFAKLDELRPHMRLYESYGQAQQFLQAKSVDLAVLPNGRAFGLQRKGVDLEIVWNEAIYFSWNGAPVPKGAPNVEAVHELLSYMAKPEPQAEFAKLTAYGPTVSAAYDLLDEKTRKNLPGAPETVDLAALVDAETLAKQTATYIDKFTTWLAKS